MIGSRQDNKILLYIRFFPRVTCFGHLRLRIQRPVKASGPAEPMHRAVSAWLWVPGIRRSMASIINTIFINYLPQDDSL